MNAAEGPLATLASGALTSWSRGRRWRARSVLEATVPDEPINLRRPVWLGVAFSGWLGLALELEVPAVCGPSMPGPKPGTSLRVLC